MDWHAIKNRGIPKDKCSTCKIDDEEAVLTFDDRCRNVTIKHDPKMLFPVLNVNLVIKKTYRSMQPSIT